MSGLRSRANSRVENAELKSEIAEKGWESNDLHLLHQLDALHGAPPQCGGMYQPRVKPWVRTPRVAWP
jgi:hypothetical protein